MIKNAAQNIAFYRAELNDLYTKIDAQIGVVLAQCDSPTAEAKECLESIQTLEPALATMRGSVEAIQAMLDIVAGELEPCPRKR